MRRQILNDINTRIQTIIGSLVIENAALKLQIEQLQAQLAASKTTADPKPPPFDQNATS